MATDIYLPVARPLMLPIWTEPAPQRGPSNWLRTLVGVSLGAVAGLAVDVLPLVQWLGSLV
jgi:hypothetical protein